MSPVQPKGECDIRDGLQPRHGESGAAARRRGSMPMGQRQVFTSIEAKTKLVRSRPHVALVPLIIFALLVGFGCFGVSRAGQSYVAAAKNQAQVVCQSAAKILQYYLSVAAAPLQQLTALVLQDPYYPRVLNNTDVAWPAVWQAAPRGTVSINLSPFGIMARIYPESPFLSSWMNTDNFKLQGGAAAANRVLNFYSTPTSGPLVYVSGGLITFFSSVHIRANKTETWNFPVHSIPYNTSWCQLFPDACFNATNGDKWWGLVSITCDRAGFTMMSQATAHVQATGYQVQVKIPAVPGLHGASSMVNFNPAADANIDPAADAAMEVINVGDDTWEVYVWKTWTPSWLRGMYAVVVVGAFVICLLLTGILFSWEEHRALLHSLLPKETIQRMREEADWSMMDKHEKMIDTVSLETPAKNMLQVIAAVLHGDAPSLQLLVSVKDALQRSADVYKPTVADLRDKMKESEFVDAEVRQALVAQLVGSEADVDSVFTIPTQPGDIQTGTQAGNRSHPGCKRAKSRSSLYAGANSSQVRIDFSQDISQVLKQMITMAQVDGKEAAVPVRVSPAVLQENPDEAEAAALMSVPPPLMLQLDTVLSTVNDWSFDVHALEEASSGYPLSVLGYYLLHQSGLITWAQINTYKLVRFLQQIEDMYPENPYHNRKHAANVLQSFHVILHQGGFIPGFVDQLTMLGCYLAAIIHDVGHKGCNNDYLVNTHDDLAITYNDKSPLESFHVAAAFRLLKLPEFNCLTGGSSSAPGLSKANWIKLRKLVIELVLATDMKAHFATMGQFDAMVKSEPSLSTRSSLEDRNSLTASPKGSALPSVASSQQQDAALTPLSEADRLLTLQVALKCADVGHLTSPLSSHLRWVSALEQEFFLQGDAERAAGLAVSPLCDRNKEGVTKSQVGFFDFVVIPMFKLFCGRFRTTRPLWHQLMDNYKYWCIAAKGGEAALKTRLSMAQNASLELKTKPSVAYSNISARTHSAADLA